MTNSVDLDTKSNFVSGQLTTQRVLKYLGQFLFHPEFRLKNNGPRTYKQRSAIADARSMDRLIDLFCYLIERSNYSKSRFGILTSRPGSQKPVSAGVDYAVIALDPGGSVTPILKSWLNDLLQSGSNNRLFLMSFTDTDYDLNSRIIEKLPKSVNFDILHIIQESIANGPDHEADFEFRFLNHPHLNRDVLQINASQDVPKKARKEWIEALAMEKADANAFLKQKQPSFSLAFSFNENGRIKGHWLFKSP